MGIECTVLSSKKNGSKTYDEPASVSKNTYLVGDMLAIQPLALKI
jgi:hypothetical protein